MKSPQVSLVCLCLFGATQLASSQVKAPTAHAIPGFLDPRTGKFTTQAASAAGAQPSAQTAVTGTGIFFREDFQVSISNYDQPAGATAVCEVSMGTGDANGYFEEYASVAAVQSGGGFTCDVPVLTKWTLQTPTSDTISASVSVTIYSQTTPVPIYRSSTQSLSLTVPGNTQTVVNTVSFQI